MQIRLHSHRLVPYVLPPLPWEPEDVIHYFTACPHVSAAWSFLVLRVTLVIGGPVADRLLIMFAWPSSAADQSIASAVAAYAELAWLSRDNPEPLLLILVHARVAAATAEKVVSSIFQS
jgi:hypothetical protein